MKPKILTSSLIVAAALIAGPVDAGWRGGGWRQGGEAVVTAVQAPLSAEETATLRYMREEEKMARDVYLTLADLWEHPVFINIARSEQRHLDAVGRLIEAYGVPDPVVDDSVGAFENQRLAELYRRLIDEGSLSLEAALQAGAYIEEIDILDLEEDIASSSRPDLVRVYENLLRASRNHLRIFVRLLENRGIVYEPQALDSAAFSAIVDSPMERGGRRFR